MEELVDEGQYFEAEVVDGVENAPPADEAKSSPTSGRVVEGENVPDEELPGEQRVSIRVRGAVAANGCTCAQESVQPRTEYYSVRML